MAVLYQPVIWNRNKIVYDAVLIVSVTVYIYAFLRFSPEVADHMGRIDGAIRQIRAWGTCAFLMLTLILCIGPLARLDKRFTPLLYNRRHFGVMTAMVASIHGSKVLGWYFAFSPGVPYDGYWFSNVTYTQLYRLLESGTGLTQFIGFPIELIGIAAFIILVIMAVTSHDFWMHFLTPPLWKAIHMSVYACYGLVVMHVSLGYVQTSKDPTFAIIVAISIIVVTSLHLTSAIRESRREKAFAAKPFEASNADGVWLEAGRVSDIADKRATITMTPDGEKVAIYRYNGKLSAISNACAHQNGPLGEGRIIGGCVTCPWHGFQYNPENGRSPAPFTEKIATFRLRLDGDRVLLDPRPNPPGTHVDPVIIPDTLNTEPAA